jgi:hypothetical protein
MSTTIFEEHQSFRRPWLWALMLTTLAVLLVASLLGTEGLGTEGHIGDLWIGFAIILAIVVLRYSIRLTVQVDTEAVRIRLFPLRFFPFWNKTIPLDDIVRWEARTDRPILEYGGLFIRYTLGRGWAYKVSGNQSVQLDLANGQRILIGSQRADELAKAIGEGKH